MVILRDTAKPTTSDFLAAWPLYLVAMKNTSQIPDFARYDAFA